ERAVVVERAAIALAVLGEPHAATGVAARARVRVVAEVLRGAARLALVRAGAAIGVRALDPAAVRRVVALGPADVAAVLAHALAANAAAEREAVARELVGHGRVRARAVRGADVLGARVPVVAGAARSTAAVVAACSARARAPRAGVAFALERRAHAGPVARDGA